MKRIIPLYSLLFSFCSFGVTIPLASPRQIAASPLERGEVARVEHDSGKGENYAELYVGGQHGPLRIADGSALRGYRVRTLDPSEYSVSASAGWTHDVESGKYTATQAGNTNTIIVTTKDGVLMDDVNISYEIVGASEMVPDAGIYYSERVNTGTTYTWDVAFKSATAIVISKISVVVREMGEIDWLNDTGKVTFRISDALGIYNLYDLRRDLLHFYDGNRGGDWSAYKAYRPVRIGGCAIRFTDDNRFTMSLTSDTNLVLQAGFRDAIEVDVRTNAPIKYTTFSITTLDIGSANQGGPIEVDFTTDIANFNAENIGVKVCNGLEDNVWLGLAQSDFAVSNVSTSGGFTTGTVTISNGITGSRRFLRLMYGAAVSDVIDVVLHGRVVIKDLLIIKGTDNKFYRINVNGGTISAQEVTL